MAAAVGRVLRGPREGAGEVLLLPPHAVPDGARRAVVVGDAVQPPLRPGRSATRSITSISTSSSTPSALGWDGICVNEHHQNCYGTMPSPNVMAAMLVRRTTRAKIAILGNGLPLRENPLRIAEEIAMLDVVSGGRIISGFVRGIGAEYFSTGVNPTHSRERFYEAADLILRAWTEPGPFAFDGSFYRYHVREPVAAAAPAAAPARVVPVAGLERDGRVGGQAPLPVPDGLHADQAHRPDLRRVPRGVRAQRLHGQPLPAHGERADRRGRERRARREAIAEKHVMWVFNVGPADACRRSGGRPAT